MRNQTWLIALAGTSCAAVLGCSAGSYEEGDEVSVLEQGIRKGLPGAVNGMGDYCHPINPCVTGEGDCDAPNECAAGTVCGTDNGDRFDLDSLVDVCVPAHCTNGAVDAGSGETDVDCGGPCGVCQGGAGGDGDFCTTGFRCSSGQGDCDTNAECQAGLVCASDKGKQFNYTITTDVCLPAHCTNSAVDAGSGETGVDCGGPCGTCLPSLLMTEIADYATNTLLKYVEVYNASGQPLNLSQFTIHSYLNGAVTPTRSEVLPNVVLGVNKTYVVVKLQGATAYQTTFSKTADHLSTIPNGDGNDVYSITKGGTVVDIYGEVGVNGLNKPWDYRKKIAKRNAGVTAGSPVWFASEWTITAGTATANPGVRN
jgi:hypothetical protein